MSYLNAFKKLKKNVKKYSSMLYFANKFSKRVKNNTSRFKNPTGHLKKSIKTGGNDRKAYTETNVPYAKIQDIGGIIRPKNAKMLKIPLVDHPSDSNLFILRKNNKLFLMNKSNKRIEYILKKQVKIKGTRYWTDGYNWIKKQIAKIKMMG